MPYKDPVRAKESAIRRKRKYLQRKHDEKFGVGAGNMIGKHGNNLKGPDNPRWNKGQLISSHGYILVRVPKHHPLAFGAGYAYEHDFVMYQNTGMLPDSIWLVHHKNENQKDNRFDNLEWKARGPHTSDHSFRRNGKSPKNPEEWTEELRVRELPWRKP